MKTSFNFGDVRFETRGSCGHCSTESVSLTFVVAKGQTTSRSGNSSSRVSLALICGSCGLLNLFRASRTGDQHAAIQASLEDLVHSRGSWRGVVQWPHRQVPEIPKEVPDSIAKMFEQAEKAIAASSWSLAGVGYRASIDRATKELGETKGSLAKRIEALKQSSSITPDLADWAHEVRLGGNEGAHELDDLTEQEAKELRDFAKLFLEMAFTMPKRIADAQAKRTANKPV